MHRTRGHRGAPPADHFESAASGAWTDWQEHNFSAPVETFRTSLYTASELYAPAPGVSSASNGGYADSLDARAYAWARTATDQDASLAQSLHDHAIDEALADWVEGRRLVGVMGGHAVQRGEDAYADAARLGHRLGEALTVATGGGPGAMEAANLGALLGSPHDLATAVATLATVPSFDPVGPWAQAAFEVIKGADADTLRTTLGIPTWHYGHEPPNVFATAIAKYFKNAVREAILLQICNAGIVFLPGAAGTVQEIFQDACENYYGTPDTIAPMVLVGVRHWTQELPAWPLLQAMAAGRPMADHLHLVDTVDEAADLLLG